MGPVGPQWRIQEYVGEFVGKGGRSDKRKWDEKERELIIGEMKVFKEKAARLRRHICLPYAFPVCVRFIRWPAISVAFLHKPLIRHCCVLASSLASQLRMLAFSLTGRPRRRCCQGKVVVGMWRVYSHV